MKRNKLAKCIVGISASLLTGGVLAVPTQESAEQAIPLTLTGTIVEVLACEFTGGAETGLTFDFTATSPETDDQYQTEGDANLIIDCTNGSEGNQYAVRMDTTTGGEAANYNDRSADVNVFVGSQSLTALISADQDGSGFQTVDQEFSPVPAGDQSTFAFRAEIQNPNGATGAVSNDGDPTLHVRFDGEPRGPLLGIGPLGGADAPLIDAANDVLNQIRDNDPTPITDNVYPQITEANRQLNDALGGGGGSP